MDEQKDLQQNSLWKYVEKVKKRIHFRNNSKTLSILATIAVVLAIPVTVLVSQQRQNLKQRAATLQTVEVPKHFVFDGNEQVYFDNSRVTFPSGTIGHAVYTDGTDTPGYFTVTPIKRGNTLYVFVIGEGGASSGKPNVDWYNLFVTSTTDGKLWTPYRRLGGNLSTPVSTLLDGGKLYVSGSGYNIDTNDGKTIGPSEQYYLLDIDSGVWDLVDPNGFSKINPSIRYPINKIQPPTPDRSIEINGKTFTFEVINGKLVAHGKSFEQVADSSSPTTNTPTPRPGSNPTATTAPVVVDRSCLIEGCGRTASRCSKNYGCTRAYYTPVNENSCGEPQAGSVTYKKDASCPALPYNATDDTKNTPCHSSDLTDLRRTYGESTPICSSTGQVLPTLIPDPSTPTPTPTRSSNSPTATSTPVPSTTVSSIYSQFSCHRCSVNYGCKKAHFNSNDSCTNPIGDVKYEMTLECPALNDTQVQYIMDNGWTQTEDPNTHVKYSVDDVKARLNAACTDYYFR